MKQAKEILKKAVPGPHGGYRESRMIAPWLYADVSPKVRKLKDNGKK